MNPCPCDYYGEPRYHCTDYKIHRYRSRLSGPIMNGIDIQKNFREVDILNLQTTQSSPSSKQLPYKIERVRNIQKARYAKLPGINSNAQTNPDFLETYCALDAPSIDLL